MKVLTLGGTGWLGAEVVRAAVAAGHQVTCVARGDRVPAGAELVRADRDVDDALTVAGIAGQQWDAVIDVTSQPGHVRRAVRDLGPTIGRYLFVSTVSVYADNSLAGADESAARLPPLESDTVDSMADYGNAKVACEDLLLAGMDASEVVIARAGLIGGPGDRSWRSVYWPWRFAHPADSSGQVLVPDQPGLWTAVIDVRDLAAWLLQAAVTAVSGIFTVQGVPMTLADHLAVAREVGGVGAAVPVPSRWLADHQVNPWMGPRSLPLWLDDPDWFQMSNRSTARAESAGLQRRPLAETLRDGLAWAEASGSEPASGLTDDEETTLLASLLGR